MTTPVPSFRVAASSAGVYPLAALGLLAMTAQFQPYAFVVVGPELARTLGLTPEALAGLAALGVLAYSVAAVPMAAAVEQRPRRAAISIACALIWSVATLATGLVVATAGLVLLIGIESAARASLAAMHPPLVFDTYPPEARMRALSLYSASASLGAVVAPLLVALLDALRFTWRGVFVMGGLACGALSLAAVGLRDPGPGHWELDRSGHGGARVAASRGQVAHLGVAEAIRRLLVIPTVRRVLAVQAVLGVMLIPLYTFLFFFLEGRWNLGPGARGMFFAALSMAGAIALAASARNSEAAFAADPAGIVRSAARRLGLGVMVLVLGLASPVLAAMAVLACAAAALLAVLNPVLDAVLLSVVPPFLRAHAAALVGVFFSLVGGLGGVVVLAGVERRYGMAGALSAVAGPGLVAALLLHRVAATVNTDLASSRRALAEEEEIAAQAVRGLQPPLLACRGVEFAYDGLRVLFGVDLVVNEGEVVALLGSNGAGKSTLLRVLAGLEMPQAGTVRWQGHDITYLDTDRRLVLGIAPVFGGRAVFPSLTVAENLRLFAHSLGRERRVIQDRIEAALDAFPALASHRNQPASALSGGERQMLGLARAIVLAPRLVLLDEPTLGLAPGPAAAIVSTIERMTGDGTAVLLVEQSPAVAFSMAGRAYVLDRGEVRFEGTATELRDRPELLGSVFLAPAARAFEG